MSATVTTTTTTKAKTKAKQRYLKAKKERRKHRKSTTNVNRTNLNADDDDDESDELSGSDDEKDLEEDEPAIEDIEVEGQPTLEIAEEKPKKEKHPKKKRKLSFPPTDKPQADVGNDNVMDIDVGLDDKPTEVDLPLPTFAPPVVPNPPPKSLLAAQGLDSAFLNAEVVDPALSYNFDEDDGADGISLSPKMKARLKELGINSLFAVQAAIIPFLLSPEYRKLYVPYDPPPDACISAPTGSGKTLAYVIPIIELLATRSLTHLRALVVLPTRDLVTQVRESFETLAKGHGLKIGTATGQHSFAHEQNALVRDLRNPLAGGSSKVDILLCTPGRLIDHLDSTPNFTLQHLRFLVIDEADRLLAESFQGWLGRVLNALNSSPIKPSLLSATNFSPPHVDLVAPTHLPPLRSLFSVMTDSEPQSSCQKLLFSATLTSDPGKLKKLQLRDAKYFIVTDTDNDGKQERDIGKFEMPIGLSEHYIVVATESKPLLLFYIIHTHQIRNALVFTKSTESTTQLLKLFEQFEKHRIMAAEKLDAQDIPNTAITAGAYSSDLAPQQRKSTLQSFRNGGVSILVCSDLISRGIDIPHVDHVISYDAPVDIRKYVHRVGRTARAGREGKAWSLIEEQEAHHFKLMLRDAGHLERVKKLKVSDDQMSIFMPFYQDSLKDLQKESGS